MKPKRDRTREGPTMRKPRPIQPPSSYKHLRKFLSCEEFAKLDREMKKGLPPVPTFELIPDFLNAGEAATLFDNLMRLPGFKFETGSPAKPISIACRNSTA